MIKTQPKDWRSSFAGGLEALLYVQEWWCSIEVAERHGGAPDIHCRQSCWSVHVPHRLLDTWRCLYYPEVSTQNTAGQG
jgi:hypothetical protein